MHHRTLGRTGWIVSEVGYGAWGIGGNQWRGHREEESLAALRRALELGLNFIDTALAYNEGHSERIIARVLKQTGARAYVATKIPPMNRLWPARPGVPLEQVFPSGYVRECTETSLRNLGAETIDLQQYHVWNPEWLDREEWRRDIEDLKASGKVRYFGISINDHQPDSALDACRTGLIDTVQVIYNIFDQSPELNLLPLCRELNIGVLARVPFDEGALTGAITPESTFDAAEFRAAGLDEPLPHTALRFILTHRAVSTVIPGMRRVRNVEENLAIPAKGALSQPILNLPRQHAWEKNFYGP